MAVVTFPRGIKVKVSDHFVSTEFDCRCAFSTSFCTHTYLDTDLVESLEELRKIVGLPLLINSAYRCSWHNKVVGGKPGSTHLQGKAADVATPHATRDDLVAALREGPRALVAECATRGAVLARLALQVERFRNGGIGTYDSFAHVDVRGRAARWNG